MHPKIPAALLKEVQALAARNDREVTDGYERQAVITETAYLLGQAGLWKPTAMRCSRAASPRAIRPTT